MKQNKLLKSLLAAGVAAGAMSAGAAQAKEDLFPDMPGKIILDVRLRSEMVDQAGAADEAEALTLRTRFGYESENYSGFQFLVEGENVTALTDDFNDTINGKTMYPVVADPDTTELNRLQVTYTGFDKTAIIVGRQRVILGDARYVGNVGFRQNEQTFDAGVIAHKPTDNTSVTYAYFGRVRRIFGDDHPAGELDMSTHALWGTWKNDHGTLTGFGFFADVQDADAISHATYGANWTGKVTDKDGFFLKYSVEYAHQTEYADSPFEFDLNLFRSEVTLGQGGLSGGVGVERLGGDGSRGFMTPLATLHKFNGWADAFLTTPSDGLRDAYAKVNYKVKSPPIVKGLSFGAVFHDFQSENGDLDMGWEFDAVATAKLTDHTSLQVKYAKFDGKTHGPADREKLWVALSLKF